MAKPITTTQIYGSVAATYKKLSFTLANAQTIHRYGLIPVVLMKLANLMDNLYDTWNNGSQTIKLKKLRHIRAELNRIGFNVETLYHCDIIKKKNFNEIYGLLGSCISQIDLWISSLNTKLNIKE